METKLTNHIDERLNKLHSQLLTAQQSYSRTKDQSWAMRVQELSGRAQELEEILRIINRSIR